MTTTYAAPQFSVVGDSRVTGGTDIDWALKDGLNIDEGTCLSCAGPEV